MRAIDPATETPLREYPDHTPAQVEERVRRAAEAFTRWRHVSFADRASLMRRVGEILRSHRDEFARLMTSEMGKPITGSEAELDKCAATCEWFADHAAALLADEQVISDAAHSFVRYEPLGPVLAIMPWNFPFWQAIRFAAPSLMAGNVGLLKHAPNVPGCALAIEALFREAGFPEGVFSTLLVQNPEVEAIIRHPLVAAVTLTGSERAGSAVAAQAGSEIKKTVLELGGSDPFIVLADADIESVSTAAAAARCVNSGQSCIAAKRFIVEDAIAERFEPALTEKMAAMKIGDPARRDTQVGPLARLDLLENLARQVERSVAAGARLLVGGKRLPRRGFFYEPTVLADVTPGMPAFDEETFGPVAAVIRANDVDDAIRLANLSRYGLGASLWTKDVARAERLAGRIEAGNVFINAPVKSDARLPFGGIKRSGYGRELAAVGIKEFVNVKTVWTKHHEVTDVPTE